MRIVSLRELKRELHAQNKKPWEQPKRITAKDLMSIEPTSFMDSIRVAITSPIIDAAQKRHEDVLRKVNDLELKKEFKIGNESSKFVREMVGEAVPKTEEKCHEKWTHTSGREVMDEIIRDMTSRKPVPKTEEKCPKKVENCGADYDGDVIPD